LKKTLKQNITQEAEQHTWDKAAVKVRNIYKDLLIQNQNKEKKIIN